jgi:hypothetical protein
MELLDLLLTDAAVVAAVLGTGSVSRGTNLNSHLLPARRPSRNTGKSACTSAWLRFISAAISARSLRRLSCASGAGRSRGQPRPPVAGMPTRPTRISAATSKACLFGLMAQVVAVLFGQGGAQGWMVVHDDPSVVRLSVRTVGVRRLAKRQVLDLTFDAIGPYFCAQARRVRAHLAAVRVRVGRCLLRGPDRAVGHERRRLGGCARSVWPGSW